MASDQGVAIEQTRQGATRQVAQIRAALGVLDGDPPRRTDPKLADDVVLTIVEELRESYSALDVDTLFDKIAAVAHAASALAHLKGKPELAALADSLERKLEKRADDLRTAVEKLGKEFDTDGAKMLRCLADTIEEARAASASR